MRRGLDTDFIVAVEMAVHSKHSIARDRRDAALEWGDTFVVVPSVLSEFIHVVTDPRRFDEPMPMEEARQRARKLWTMRETEQLHTDQVAIDCFFQWHEKYRLGRKRLHDTLLASTPYTAGVKSLLTLNPSDFRIFDCFEFHPNLF